MKPIYLPQRSLSILAAFLLGGTALQASAVFADNDFSSGWSSTIVTNQNMTSSTFTTTNPATGGNGGFYRRESHTMVQAVPGSFATGRWFNWLDVANYNPSSQGAIISLAYSFDNILEVGFGQGVGYALALRQNGLYYRSDAGAADAAAVFSWVSHAHSGLSSAFFSEVGNFGSYPFVNTSSNPDFSSTGSNIEFGYIVENAVNPGTYTLESGIDNWRVEITSAVPEPGTAELACAGIGLLAVYQRRRKSKQFPAKVR